MKSPGKEFAESFPYFRASQHHAKKLLYSNFHCYINAVLLERAPLPKFAHEKKSKIATVSAA